jgi:hypothetical protein
MNSASLSSLSLVVCARANARLSQSPFRETERSSYHTRCRTAWQTLSDCRVGGRCTELEADPPQPPLT